MDDSSPTRKIIHIMEVAVILDPIMLCRKHMSLSSALHESRVAD